MPTHKFFLPWPDKALKVNGSHGHWAAKLRARKKAKEQAYWLALESGLGKIESDAIALKLTFYPPTRHRFDSDNLLASHKAAIDGISMAIGVDDSKFQITFGMAGTIEKGGMVRVQLDW